MKRGGWFGGAVGFVVLALIAINVVASLHYRSYYRQALDTLRASRGHPEWPIDSYEFITRGIPCGASEEEVDKILHNADRTSRLTLMASGRRCKNYSFHYKPEYPIPFTHQTQLIVMEMVTVFFDAHEKACALERTLAVNGDASLTGTTEWDLCAKKQIAAD